MSDSSQVVESWISSFCGLLGHEYFAEVSEDFIEDDFNLTGLSSQVPMYKEALEMILDVEPEEEDEEEEEEEDDDDDDEEDGQDRPAGYRRSRHGRVNADLNVIESSAELLYGLIHQRYITSRPGIGQMHEKYEQGHFGTCPRVFCHGCKVLPVGCSDTPGQETVKLYCPGCLDVYTPPNSRFQTVDGAFFGTTFGCLFFMTFPELPVSGRGEASSPTSVSEDKSQPLESNGVSTSNLAPGLGAGRVYEARIYGFKVSERAKSGPRMKWLRMKPDDVRELDETRRFHASGAEEGESEGAEESEAPESAPQQVDKRKKAPIRRRRRINSEDSAVPMDNGLDGVG